MPGGAVSSGCAGRTRVFLVDGFYPNEYQDPGFLSRVLHRRVLIQAGSRKQILGPTFFYLYRFHFVDQHTSAQPSEDWLLLTGSSSL